MTIDADVDPLRSDGELLEAALKKAGVKVHRKVYSRVTHEFLGGAAVVSKVKDAQSLAVGDLTKAFKN